MKRLIKFQQADIDYMLDFINQQKPLDLRDIGEKHELASKALNESIDQFYVLAELTKSNPELSKYYTSIFQRLNQISSSLEKVTK